MEKTCPAGKPFSFKPRWLLMLTGVFFISFLLRLYGVFTFGFDLDGPGTLSIVNFDETGSCRASLKQFSYSPFIGHQTVAIARFLGYNPPALQKVREGTQDANRNASVSHTHNHLRAKFYCLSKPVLLISRVYSAFSGALTVVLLGLLGYMMWPSKPQIAWTACALLAFSNFHVAHSHWGTVDAPQLFFILLFTCVLVYGVVSKKTWPLLLSFPLLVAAIWVKYYVFAVLAYVCLLPCKNFRKKWPQYLTAATLFIVVVILITGWDNIVDVVSGNAEYVTWGTGSSHFGTGYDNIGVWRRLIRNFVGLPLVHIVGLGLPAVCFAVYGLKRVYPSFHKNVFWLAQLPAAAYAAYMLLIAPVTYYRHYLPLFPTVALLAAYGFWKTRWSKHRLIVACFVLYPLLLTIDSEYNFRCDPRRDLRSWYQEKSDARVLASFYVVPPPYHRSTRLFDMQAYVDHGRRYLARADYLILSENWYHTAFPNELNGPIAWKPEWLIKTRPEFVIRYRKILAGKDPNLAFEKAYTLRHFMPEFLVHRLFYGSFQLFIGDLKIYRIMQSTEPQALRQGPTFRVYGAKGPSSVTPVLEHKKDVWWILAAPHGASGLST